MRTRTGGGGGGPRFELVVWASRLGLWVVAAGVVHLLLDLHWWVTAAAGVVAAVGVTWHYRGQVRRARDGFVPERVRSRYPGSGEG